MRTIDQMVQQEILCCMSHIVSVLAQGEGYIASPRGLQRSEPATAFKELAQQAAELCYPIPDYEEAAIQESWTGPYKDEFGATYFQCGADAMKWACADWEALCRDHDIEPYDREVFEHWAVTDWFADRLIKQGEKVDKDFGNLCIWARTTTGQGIASDGVVERIYAKMMQPEPA